MKMLSGGPFLEAYDTTITPTPSAMKKRVVCVVVLATLSLVADLSAHDTWLLPHSMRVAVGTPIAVSLTSGQAFPADDFAIVPARVTRATVRLAGVTSALPAPQSAKLSLRYVWVPRTAGLASIAVELAPKTLTLAPEKIEEYFLDINASRALRAAWDSVPSPKRWRESYVKHAMSYVRVGNAGVDTSWRHPLGLGFEIVPEVDPTALRAGDAFPVRVLRAGLGVAHLQVGLQHEGDPHVEFSTTDATGRTRVILARSGRWLVNVTDLRRSAKPGLEWESDFATMTIATTPTH